MWPNFDSFLLIFLYCTKYDNIENKISDCGGKEEEKLKTQHVRNPQNMHNQMLNKDNKPLTFRGVNHKKQ